MKQKVVVITGSAHGIGQAIAQFYKEKGDIVCGIDITPGQYFQGDISDPKVLQDFVGKIRKDYGGVNILVNNAKPAFIGINTCSYEQFVNALQVGIAAPFYLSQLLLDLFEEASSIINISSTRDSQSMPQSESYAAAKGGINALTHAMAISLGPKIRVNAISPGWIDVTDSDFSKADNLQQPVGRVGNVMDIVWLTDFLSDETKAGFITGQNIRVDGGMSKLMIYHEEHGWTFNPEE